MAGGYYRSLAAWKNLMDQLMSQYYGGLGGGVSNIVASLFEGQKPILEDLIKEYYGGAAGLGQIVPGEGGSSASQQGLENLFSDYMSDLTTTALGAYQMPWQAYFGGTPGAEELFGMGRREKEWKYGMALQGGSAAGQGMSSGMGSVTQGCCFNFLAAEGQIFPTVKRYRDQFYGKDGLVGKGYYLTASWFVPLMAKHRWFKRLIQIFMTRPIKAYTDWFYKQNRYGFLFYPFGKTWEIIWKTLGGRFECPV